MNETDRTLEVLTKEYDELKDELQRKNVEIAREKQRRGSIQLVPRKTRNPEDLEKERIELNQKLMQKQKEIEKFSSVLEQSESTKQQPVNYPYSPGSKDNTAMLDCERQYQTNTFPAENSKLKGELAASNSETRQLTQETNILGIKLRFVQSSLKSIVELIKFCENNLSDEEKSIRDFLEQISEGCLEISEFKEYELKETLSKAKVEFENRNKLLKERKAAATNSIKTEFNLLVAELVANNKNRDLRIFEPFLSEINSLIEKASIDLVTDDTENEKKSLESRFSELMAAKELMEVIRHVLLFPWVIQRLKRLRDSGYDEEFAIKSQTKDVARD